MCGLSLYLLLLYRGICLDESCERVFCGSFHQVMLTKLPLVGLPSHLASAASLRNS
jgi:hypothetical protein